MEALASNDITPVEDRPALEGQIEVIRSEIDKKGESIVGCEELRVLCDDEVAPCNQWTAIALIATHQGWSFTFFPDLQHVRFAML